MPVKTSLLNYSWREKMPKKTTKKKKMKIEFKQEYKPEPEPKKKKITKYRVTIHEQWRQFHSQNEARDFARKVLQNDSIYYMTCEKVEVNDD